MDTTDFPWAFPEAKGAVFVDPNDLPDDAEAPLFGLPPINFSPPKSDVTIG
jgi:hypothetical protein